MIVGIFYGSNSGATESIAEQIRNELDLEADIHDIADIGVDTFDAYSHIIIGTSTWGDGDLQDDWAGKLSEFESVNFSGKTVAFFGLGDQEGYDDHFVDGMGILYNIAVKNGATAVGDKWPTDGYDFRDSIAVQNGTFVGLAIDEDNQDDLTKERVHKWVAVIKPYFQK
jgi:flavodoxin I